MKNRFEGENLIPPPEQEKIEPPQEQAAETQVEQEPVERQLSPEEVGEFRNEMDEYTQGLRARVAELEAEQESLRQMSEEADSFARMREIETELADLHEQIDGLQDSKDRDLKKSIFIFYSHILKNMRIGSNALLVFNTCFHVCVDIFSLMYYIGNMRGKMSKKYYVIKTRKGIFDALIWWDAKDKVYIVKIPSFSDLATFGKTIDEAKRMAKDIIELHCECILDEGKLLIDDRNKVIGRVPKSRILTAVSA